MNLDIEHSALLTDFYELAMLQTYYEAGMTGEAVFELFLRDAGPARPFFIAAGVRTLIAWLEQLHFERAELDYLADTGKLSDACLDRLAELRFTGEVHALPEGTACFPGEPLVRVRAPLPEAQLIESRLMNIVHLETLLTTKAARCRLAAGERLLIDFGLRRAHGAEAGLLAGRACYLGGFDATATVLAGQRFGVPIAGTMAHSFILAHDDEVTAFERFARSHPNNTVLLIDTYDVPTGARNAVTAAARVAADGIRVQGVRIDSGDLAENATTVRAILDEGGLTDTRILVSGGLDEHGIVELLATGAPIDGFGVGSKVDTSSDVPFLDCAYKLHEYAGTPRAKRSRGKGDMPGVKQVYRRLDEHGRFAGDTLALANEPPPANAEPLLIPVMRGGRALPLDDTETVRRRVRSQVGALPDAQRTNAAESAYPVTPTPALHRVSLERGGSGSGADG